MITSVGLTSGLPRVGERLSARRVIIEWIGLVRQVVHSLAHDRNDPLHDITAGAAGSTLD
jgi:hypothetical protein